MESLFRVDYPAHFGLAAATVASIAQTTSAPYFELEDDANGNLVVHRTRHTGMARFNNPRQLSLTLLNYEKFLNRLPPAFQHGKKRCDVLLCSDSPDYFILGELKDRLYKRTVRRDAKEQLLGPLEIILQVGSINQLATGKTTRRCCYFNKQGKAPAILSATTAFNRLSQLYPTGFQLSYPAIEAFGFEFYEYSGAQTVAL